MTDAAITIPALPCVDLDSELAFWQALGFAVTYTQRAPNPYAVIERDGYSLHLFGLKGLEPEANFTTCLVLVSEVEALHEAFAAGYRASLGRVPSRGFPRLSRMRPGQTRFTLTDPSGNSVIYVRRGPEDEQAADAYKQAGQTPLQKALHVAARLRDFKNDDAEAARVLDRALARYPDAPALDRARTLAARSELAAVHDDSALAARLRAELRALPLSPEERATLAPELEGLE